MLFIDKNLNCVQTIFHAKTVRHLLGNFSYTHVKCYINYDLPHGVLASTESLILTVYNGLVLAILYQILMETFPNVPLKSKTKFLFFTLVSSVHA